MSDPRIEPGIRTNLANGQSVLLYSIDHLGLAVIAFSDGYDRVRLKPDEALAIGKRLVKWAETGELE